MAEFIHFIANLDIGSIILIILGIVVVSMASSDEPTIDPDEEAWLHSPVNPNSPNYRGD